MKHTRQLAACRLIALAGLLCALPVHASGWLLAAPEPRVVPGQSFSVIVIAPRSTLELPERLPAQIELPDGGPRIALELVASGPTDAGSQQRRYMARWPSEVVGFATLALQESASARLVLDAGATTRSAVQTAVGRGTGAG